MCMASPHRVSNFQAGKRQSHLSGYDDGKLGHDDGKPYTLRIPWEDPLCGRILDNEVGGTASKRYISSREHAGRAARHSSASMLSTQPERYAPAREGQTGKAVTYCLQVARRPILLELHQCFSHHIFANKVGWNQRAGNTLLCAVLITIGT